MLLILFNILFPLDFIRFKKNITSLLNTTNIIKFNDVIVVGTSGGAFIYDYLSETKLNFSDDLNTLNVSTLQVCPEGYLWIGSENYNGINIFDDNFDLYSNIQYPQFNKILNIAFTDKYAFAVVSLNNNIMLAHYNIEDIKNPYYLNLYSSFPISFELVNDIEIIDNIIYLATSEGLLSANCDDPLSFSSSWTNQYYASNVSSIQLYNDDLLISINNNIINLSDQTEYVIDFLENINDMYLSNIDNQIIISDLNYIYTYNILTYEFNQHTYPEDVEYVVNDFLQIDNRMIYGLDNHGIIINNLNNDSWNRYIPETLFKNQFDAIALTEENHLIGVVNHKDDSGQSGGFIYKNPLSQNKLSSSINNFYSYNGYHINKLPLSMSDYRASIINYWSGDNSIRSAVISNENKLFFSNSGVYPPAWLGYYENVADNYLFELSNYTLYGGVVEIQLDVNNLEFSIDNVYNLSNGVLGGNSGVFNSSWTDGFMTINQITKDSSGNIWIVNPYSEHNNNPIAMNISNQWYHINYEDNDGYIPQELTFDTNNNVWISYKFSQTINNENEYSSGGIKMVEVNNLYNETDDIWHTSWLDDLHERNIWSVTFTKDNYGNQILWAMTELGIVGYLVDINYTHSGNVIADFTKINDDYFFPGLNYEEGCKLRTDYQNNVWITTKSNGLRVINGNGELLDDNMSIVNVEDNNILSNNIYDIIFDEFGYVYIATDMGISILETSFNKSMSSRNVSVSPNPFVIGEDNQLVISNISKNSIVKIMNLSGYVVKEFDIESLGKYINWNGQSDDGYNLGTGVYLLSVFNDKYGSGSTKIAVINK